MTTTLFPLPTRTFSPELTARLNNRRRMLAWAKAFDVVFDYGPSPEGGKDWLVILPEELDVCKTAGQIMEESCNYYDQVGLLAHGATKRDALQALAHQNDIRLWNEE